MSDFTIVDPEYPDVSRILLSMVRGFADSPEYTRLSEAERRLPGIVAAAFTRFLVRIQDTEVRGTIAKRDAEALSGAYQAIERLAGSRDEQVRVLVQDEIFENIRASEATWRRIETHFGERSQTLFDRWREHNPS